MPSTDWLDVSEALGQFQALLGLSPGAASAALIEACTSGYVETRKRIVIYGETGERPLVDEPLVPDHWAPFLGKVREIPSSWQISAADLKPWLAKHAKAVVLPTKNTRYASDIDLVAEAIEGLRAKRWPNANKAAEALAERAEGQSAKTSIDRLGRKIREALAQ